MKYHLYGAGQNAYGCVCFFGSEDCITLVDTNEENWGKDILGMIAKSPEVLYQSYKGEPVIISPLKYYGEIKVALENRGITNVYPGPNFLSGYYKTPMEFIEKNGITGESNVPVYGNRIVYERLKEELERLGWSKSLIYSKVPKGLADEIDLDSVAVEYRDNIKAYKNIYDGGRCFVVANGPSLRATDLTKLKEQGEITFACNYINRMFSHTDWRPDYYFAIDNEFIMEEIQMIADLMKEGVKVFVRDTMNPLNPSPINGVEYFNCINLLDKGEAMEFSEDVAKYAISSTTVTYVMLQFACYMGFKEVYLIGADTGQIDSHFYEESTLSHYSKKMLQDMVKDWIRFYEYANTVTKNIGVQVFNATRGGYLDAFTRVDIERLWDER